VTITNNTTYQATKCSRAVPSVEVMVVVRFLVHVFLSIIDFCHESCYGRRCLSDVIANILCTYVKSFAVKRMPSKKKKYNARFPAVSFALYVKEMLIMYTPFVSKAFHFTYTYLNGYYIMV